MACLGGKESVLEVENTEDVWLSSNTYTRYTKYKSVWKKLHMFVNKQTCVCFSILDVTTFCIYTCTSNNKMSQREELDDLFVDD